MDDTKQNQLPHGCLIGVSNRTGRKNLCLCVFVFSYTTYFFKITKDKYLMEHKDTKAQRHKGLCTE